MNEKAKVTDLNSTLETPEPKGKITRLHVFGVVLTILGLGLFGYFIYSVGVIEIIEGIERIGIAGFALLLLVYFVRILARALAWKLSVSEPYKLSIADTTQAVIIGEALSTMIPLGILISGTAKAVAVHRRVPIVVALSSVATENLFYSLGTGIFISLGAFVFVKTFQIAEIWSITIEALIGLIGVLTVLGFAMVIRQWRFASWICEFVYQKGFLKKSLEHGRFQVREFESLIYGFYRRYPARFIPIFLLQMIFHALGVFEVWFVLTKISDVTPTASTAFLLESISRIIIIVFKLIPFGIGVDEAGAQYITETLALGAGVGVTLAIIRKGRGLFWTVAGILMILKREISIADIFRHHELQQESEKNVVS